MLHKKLFKYLSVFVAILIIFSLFVISASASSVTTDTRVFNLPIAKPNVADNYGYIEVMYGDNSATYCEVILLNWVCRSSDNVDYTELFQLTLDFESSYSFVLFPTTFSSSDRYSVSAYTTNTAGSDYFLNSVDSPLGIGYGSGSQWIKGIKVYGNLKVYTNNLISNDDNFVVNYGSDAASYIMLGKILNQLANGSSSQTQQIIDNQDKNTDKVIQNQEENQEEITNGWQQEEEIDTSTTDDYAAKDKELQDATEQGRSEAVSVFNSFGSLFQSDGHLYKGLLSVSAIFTQFMQLDWLSSLLNFSLAIGIFAFVIGTGSQIFKSSHERYKDDKISKIDSYDERWLM